MNGIIETQTLAQNQSKRILLVLFFWYLLDEKQMLKPQKQFHFLVFTAKRLPKQSNN